jgi:hypothetical protein
LIKAINGYLEYDFPRPNPPKKIAAGDGSLVSRHVGFLGEIQGRVFGVLAFDWR